MKSSRMLTILMFIVMGLLTLIAITSDRSNAPTVTGDNDYPHYVCVINDYCDGDRCSRDPISFVAYMRHVDGLPRLELPRFSPRATLTEIPDGVRFESTGGEVSGTVSIFDDLGIDVVGTSVGQEGVVEHYASGRCESLVTP